MKDAAAEALFQAWLDQGYHSREALRKAGGVRLPASLQTMMREAFIAGRATAAKP